MKHYRVVMVEEFDPDGYITASYYQVQRRSILRLWRHVKFYDKREDALYHLVRLNLIKGRRKRITVIDK